MGGIVAAISWDRDSLCSHLAGLATSTGGYVLLRESPVAEWGVAYPETNMLAAHVLMHACGLRRLALGVLGSIGRLGGFYAPYRFLVDPGRPQPMVWARLEPRVIARLPGLLVRTMYPVGVLWDWREYADRLLALAAWLSLAGFRDRARAVLREAQGFFDGAGFRDRSWDGLYDAYKLALCIVAGRASGDTSLAGRCARILLSITPAASRYDPGLRGRGDLNVETASLAMIALYGLYERVGRSGGGEAARVALLSATWLLLPLGLVVAGRGRDSAG